MMKKFLFVSLLSTLSLNFSAFASIIASEFKDFKIENETVHTFVPEGWQSSKDFLNSPISMFSPKGAQGMRSVIQIVPLANKDDDFSFLKMKKDPEIFIEEKEKWLKSVSGKSMAYQPFTETKFDGGTIYSVGIKYKVAEGEFLDETFFVSSKSKQQFYVKALVPLDLLKNHEALVSKVLNTVSAKN